jgi:hypothetical protein
MCGSLQIADTLNRLALMHSVNIEENQISWNLGKIIGEYTENLTKK